MTTPQTRETVRRIQVAMATAYTSAGTICILFPLPILRLSLTPAYFPSSLVPSSANIPAYTPQLLFRCFAAQAMTSGLLLGVSSLSARGFMAFAGAMVPYLGFNAYFLLGPGRGVFTGWLWADFVGNVIFCGGSLWCAKLLRDDEERRVKGKGKEL